MKNVKVIVRDKTVLELAENASIGDRIDLKEIVEVDFSYIESLIEKGQDSVYNKKLAEHDKLIEARNELRVSQLNNQIENLLNEKNSIIELTKEQVKNEYIETISKLKNETDTKLLNREIALKKEFEEEKQKLIDKNSEKENKHNEEINKLKDEYSKEKLELIEKHAAALNEKQEVINNLQRQKANMNIKQIGEDLEGWCDNEVNSYMENGFLNCTWEKDNVVVKDGDSKGSKADFIFKIYANESHNEDELISSVCLDMKDENPDSVNKQTNASYYKKLDQNRNKKSCEYAVLVSNLEMDKPNIIPIFKVKEYQNMYVVRPAYLMVFLNMITSLSSRYSELILNSEKDSIELKSKLSLIEEFDLIKKKFLDKPLEDLNKQLTSITKSSNAIKKASDEIDEAVKNITSKYVEDITSKLEKFELTMTKKISKSLE